MPDLNTIPETKSAEEIAALRASDPAAFDLDEAPEQSEEAKAAKEASDKAADEAATKEAAEKAEAEKAAEEAKKSDVIPKGRFNEALRERDAERQRADALAAELEALKKGPPVDYTEEIQKLDAKWNSDDDFDGSHADYLAQRDALLAAKVEADARAKFQQEQAQRDAEARLAAWDKDARSFVDSNDRYKDADELARFNEALEIQFARNPNGTHAEWLTAADKLVQAMAIAEGRAPATTPAAPADPNAARNAADAQAAAKASAAPKAIEGGVSSAGGPIANIDMANLKPGQFSKLSKDQQEAALGGPGAL